MKKKIVAVVTAIVMIVLSAVPAFAVSEPVLTLNNPFQIIKENYVNFYHPLNLNNSGTAIDANSLTVTYNDPINGIVLTNAAELTGLNAISGKNLSFRVDTSTIEVGDYQIKLDLDYTYGGGTSGSTEVFLYLSVIAEGTQIRSYNSVTVENLAPTADTVLVGGKGSVSGCVINSGENISSLVVTVTNAGGTVLSRKYIGALASDASQDVTLDFTAPTTAGKASLSYNISYKGANGTSYSSSYPFALNVENSTPLSLQNFEYPAKVIAGAENEMTFNLVNTGNEDFIDVQASIYSGSTLITTNYIGTAAAHSSTAGSLKFSLKDAKAYNLTFKITYASSTGTKLEITRSLNVTSTSESVAAQTGTLKIQKIDAPIYSQIDTKTEVSFSITNPTATAITGAEAYIYDAQGNTVDSIYISSLDANTSTSLTMSILPTQNGKSTYKLYIYYLDSLKNKQTLTGTFSTTVKDEVGTGGETEKPAGLKIATIDAPSVIYTNVKTTIPFAVVNAGRGTAYNVEVYLTDASGNELSRDYIGSVSASTKLEGSIKVKFTEALTQTLNLCFYYENADGTTATVTKAFDQRIADYRVTVGDVTGCEYAIEGEPGTVMFSISNMGSMDFLNVNATLCDDMGNPIATSFVGTVSANSKSESLKFKKVNFMAGSYNLYVLIDYENSDGEAFTATSTPVSAYVMTYDEAYGGWDKPIEDDPSIPVDPDVQYDEYGNPIYPSEGMPVWGWILIGVGAAAVITVVVIIIVKHKKKAADQEDDMQYFYRSAPESKPSEQEQDNK